MADPTGLWRAALAGLEKTVSRDQLATWIAPLRPLGRDGAALVLGVNNELQKTYLAKHCQGVIDAALGAAAGEPVRARFEIDQAGQSVLFGAPEAVALSATRPRSARSSALEDGGLTLNPRYQFETFVVGKNNEFAHAAALGVAERQGRSHNPLFLYGGVGLGKTHLLHAIGHAVKASFPGKQVVYTTTEKFTNDVIKGIRDQSMHLLRKRYRHADLLLVDDIQFLQGKESTQEEFFHTINDLMAVQHHIVLTSDTHPKDFKVEDRLRSRFQGGLVADLQAPDVETRTAILKKKTESDGISLPEEVLAVIAEAVQSNIRELEGALNRVLALAATTGRPPTGEVAREALRDLISISRPPRTFDRVQEVVARRFSLDVALLSERTRTDAIAYPRQMAMYLCREMLGASYVLIGDKFGGRDHSTVMHAYDKIRRLKDTDPETRAHLDEIRRVLDA